MVELLLKKGASVNARTPDRFTPLMEAAYNGSPRVLEALLQRGAEVNDEDRYGCTPLMFMTIDRDGKEPHVLDIARRLLERGANATKTNHDGLNAAMMAVKNGMYDLVELLQQSSDQYSKGRETRTAFDSFIDFISNLGRDFPEDAGRQIDTLLARGCDINESREGKAPLDCAGQTGQRRGDQVSGEAWGRR